MTNWFSRPKQPETEAAADPPQSLCAVYSSNSPVEAHVVSGMLEDAGIECVLTNEFFAAVDSPVSNVTGGVQIMVRASDVDRARELLAAPPAPDAA